MFLKYLEIQGFKSFPDKTRVAFGRGLTAVVGPNGSGKSNISDAVRWVLGEQSSKTLRGEKMEDVIFSGTQTRKSLGFAEVSLTVDNTDRELPVDSDEITITRRYDRSGESEYMINRSPVRLKDVYELLMDTGLGKDGYSLIGQGKIAEIIQAKSTERREIFEEAAGISKYRYRKNESERSLTRAEENLVRLRDILSELEGRVAPLKEQAEKARQFLAFSETKKTLEVSLWVDTLEKSNFALKDQSDKLLVCQERHKGVEEEIQKIEDEIQAAFSQMQKCLVDIESMRRRKGELEAEAAEASAQIAVYENDIRHNQQNIARIEEELRRQAQSDEDTASEIEKRQEQVAELTRQLEELDRKILEKQEELTRKSSESEGLTQQERDLTDRVNALLLNQSQIKMTIASAQIGLDDLAETIRSNRQDMEAKREEIEGYSRELVEAEKFTRELEERAESLKNTWQGHKLKLDSRAGKLTAMTQECDRLNLQVKERQQKAALLSSMEQSLEGYAYSVREVMKRAKNGVLSGIRGTVSQLIEVKDEYSVAIETALGGALQNIVVDNEGNAKAAIRLLKQENLGRATFLPVTSVQGSLLQTDGLDRYAGYVDLAVNLVSFDSRYQPVFRSLLGRIVIADDIDTAVLIAQKYGYKFKIVTLDGQVVNAGGSLTGGSQNKNQGFLSRKNEIQALQAEIETLKVKYEQNRTAMAEVQTEVTRIEAEVTATAAEITTVNEDKIRVQGEQKRLAQLVSQGKLLREQMEKELAQKQEKSASMKDAMVNGQENLKQLELQIAEASGSLEQLRADNRRAAEHRTAVAEALSGFRIERLGLEKDADSIRRSVEELEQRRTDTGEQAEKLTAEQSGLTAANGEISGKIEELSSRIQASRKEAEKTEEMVRQTMALREELEGTTTQLRKQERTVQEDKEKFAAEMVRLDERRLQIQRDFDELILKLWQEYELTRNEAQKIARPLDDPQEASRELNSVRSRIKNLGSVNVAAIEEYQEVSQRYEYLSRQVRDAEQSRNELLRLIGELTQKMQDIFSENFQKINRQFKSIFVELFGGGNADLRLVEPDNLLESGIEIMVEPPGKIINNLASLSGGEQAFVAIAIYFAILKVHPAPFCILDEIEAALDDVNVDKYAAYLRAIGDKTQFITITHRRGTMEAADVLYGVTMQDEGVSKLLQLKVSEIEDKLGMGTTKA